MIRRFLLLLLIALLPLQGVVASAAVKCAGMASEHTAQSDGMPCHDAAPVSSNVPCHEHGDDGVPGAGQADQGCCHHLAVAVPQVFFMPGDLLLHSQRYPALADSFSDHLPDRLQRPPLSFVI